MGNKSILIYTFYRWQCSTYKALRQIDHISVKNYYFKGQRGLKIFLNHISKYEYKYILGIADYRKSARNVRIEGKFINKYGKSKIIDGGEAEYMPTLILDTDIEVHDKQGRNSKFYTANTAHCGPCNRSSYMCAKKIKDDALISKLAFVHIPRSIGVQEMVRMLNNFIKQLL